MEGSVEVGRPSRLNWKPSKGGLGKTGNKKLREEKREEGFGLTGSDRVCKLSLEFMS